MNTTKKGLWSKIKMFGRGLWKVVSYPFKTLWAGVEMGGAVALYPVWWLFGLDPFYKMQEKMYKGESEGMVSGWNGGVLLMSFIYAIVFFFSISVTDGLLMGFLVAGIFMLYMEVLFNFLVPACVGAAMKVIMDIRAWVKARQIAKAKAKAYVEVTEVQGELVNA